jgi:BlaR1 peptidase M56
MIMPVSIITLFLAALIYLTKVSACLCSCYLLYQLVFRRLPYHSWNRILILGMAAFSVIAPLLPLSSWPAAAPFRDLVNGYLLKTYDRLTGSPAAANSGATSGHVPALVWIVVIYGTGLLLATLRFCRDGVSVWRMVYRQNLERKEGCLLVHPAAVNASFFKLIFLRGDLEEEHLRAVLLHERYHVRRWHSLDNTFMEVFKLLLWFHPFVYGFHRLLREVHEFETDAFMKGQMAPREYAHLLLHLNNPASPALCNAYNVDPLTRRIHLLFHKPNTALRKPTYLLLLPFLILSLMMVGALTRPPFHAPEQVSRLPAPQASVHASRNEARKCPVTSRCIKRQ